MKQNAKHRLAFFIPSMSDGGAERVTLNLAQSIAQRGDFLVDLVLVSATGPYLTQVPDSIRIVDLKASRTVTALGTLIKYLRKEQPTAMLTALPTANIVAIWAKQLAKASTRVVVTEHIHLSHQLKNPSKPRGRYFLPFIKLFYRWTDGIVAVSNGVADDFSDTTGISRNRVTVIYNPVITPEMRDKATAKLDHPWFAPNSPPVILGVGRLDKQKNFELLIRATARLREVCDVRLLILGEGEERAKLEKLVAELNLKDDVSLPGFVDNPYAYMAHASLFVLSSRWEGLPTVLIEALYCGIPLVSTDCPSGPQEILAGGQYGHLVPMDDVDALVAAMKQALAQGVTDKAKSAWLPFESNKVVDCYLQELIGPNP